MTPIGFSPDFCTPGETTPPNSGNQAFAGAAMPPLDQAYEMMPGYTDLQPNPGFSAFAPQAPAEFLPATWTEGFPPLTKEDMITMEELLVDEGNILPRDGLPMDNVWPEWDQREVEKAGQVIEQPWGPPKVEQLWLSPPVAENPWDQPMVGQPWGPPMVEKPAVVELTVRVEEPAARPSVSPRRRKDLPGNAAVKKARKPYTRRKPLKERGPPAASRGGGFVNYDMASMHRPGDAKYQQTYQRGRNNFKKPETLKAAAEWEAEQKKDSA